MEINVFEDNLKWKNFRKNRIKTFIRVSVFILMALGAVWITIRILEGKYHIAGLISATQVVALYVLKLIKQERLHLAKLLMLSVMSSYFLLITYISPSGPGIEGGTAHFWFIPLCISAFFLLYDSSPYLRDGVAAIFMFIFFIFHFGFIPLPNYPNQFPGSGYIIQMVDIVSVIVLIYFLTRLFVLEITKAETNLSNYSDRLDGIIENIFPKSIAERLKISPTTFAVNHPECSVLFADIVNFTQWSSTRYPTDIVDKLNDVFLQFDEVADRMKLTKIKTIGDAYMVAAGVPDYMADHATVLLDFAREIHKIANTYDDLKLRIGINSGPAVAGIIGKKRITYDLWGDTVNVASRLEANGEINKIQISEATFQLVKQSAKIFVEKNITLKGLGKTKVYIVD